MGGRCGREDDRPEARPQTRPALSVRNRFCSDRNVQIIFFAEFFECIIITHDKNVGVTTTRVMFFKEDNTQKETPKKTQKGLNSHAGVFVPASSCLLKIFGCTCAYAIRSSTRQGHRRHVCAARWRKIQRYFKGALERRRDANSAVLPSMEAPPSRTAVVGTTEIKEKTMLDDMVAESPPRKGLNKTA